MFYYFVGSICVLCSFPFLFTYFADTGGVSSELTSLLLCSCVIAVFQFGWAAAQVSHLALIPRLTPIDQERVELSAFRLEIYSSSFTLLSYC